MEPDSAKLDIADLGKTYTGGYGVRDVSFDVRSGEVVGLLGPNGSGKSTILHSTTGIVRYDRGSISICGHYAGAAEAKDCFGFLPDDLPLPESLRLAEFTAFHRKIRRSFDLDFATALLDMLGLVEHQHKFIGDFSHGMKRKAQLAVALAHHPELLILDEPMRGLDPESSILVHGIVSSIRARDGGVLLATHDLDAAENLCDRVVIMNEGQMVGQGAPSDLIARTGGSSLRDFFVEATGLRSRIDAAQERLTALMARNADPDRTRKGDRT